MTCSLQSHPLEKGQRAADRLTIRVLRETGNSEMNTYICSGPSHDIDTRERISSMCGISIIHTSEPFSSLPCCLLEEIQHTLQDAGPTKAFIFLCARHLAFKYEQAQNGQC